MWHWLALGTLALFAGASASRRAKQRVAEAAWHEALPRHFATMLRDLDADGTLGDAREAARALAGSAIFTFYEAAGVSDFAGLMRALSSSSGPDRQSIEAQVVGRLLDAMPVDADPIVASRLLRRALTGAGQEAMAAARRSRHV